MKQLAIIVAVALTAFFQHANAAILLPHLADVRAEITNQLTIASNAPTFDKKLATSLRKSLTLIDKPGKTSVANDLKVLGLVAKTLNRTSVSNEFDAEFNAAITAYFNDLNAASESSADRLDTTYPGRLREAAAKALQKVLDGLEDGAALSDLVSRAKLLSKVAAAIVRADLAIARAEDAPAPPARIVAQVTGSLRTSIKTQGAGIVAGDSLIINGAQTSGTTLHQINFVCLAVPEGTSTVNLNGGNVNVVKFPGVAINYGNGTGTATVTRNNVNRTAFGTFTFTATGVSGTTGNITVTGEFSGTF
jgi:hypothetical protein